MTTPVRELSPAEKWAALPEAARRELIESLPTDEVRRLLYDWGIWARPDQRLPPPMGDGRDWLVWALISGRGAGKTRTGAETIKQWVGGPNDPPIRIALVAQSAPDARDVMVEGDSGLLAVSPPWNRPVYQPSRRRLVWPNGSVGITFSGDKPDQLRGPQFHKAWVDEIAKFQYPTETWDNLELGLRLGTKPQAIVTTTPRPIPIIKALVKDPLTVVTSVSTYANIANLAPSFIARVIKKYEGTRLGRQELYAAILDDTPGALWTYDMIEAARIEPGQLPPMQRVVIAVDPAVSAEEDSNETGIAVVGRGMDFRCYVLQDASGIYTPDEWGRKVIELFEEWGASRIVAEVNQGGKMVEAILRSRHKNIPYRAVRASQGKVARAEPVAALYEQNRVKHVGQFSKMEDQMTAITPDGYQGAGSPDRVDALVWGCTDLMFGIRASTNADDYAGSKW